MNNREPRTIFLGTSSPARIFSAVSIASAPPVGYWNVALEDALRDVGDAFLRQGVDADEHDVLLAAGRLGRQVRAVGPGIVVGVDDVDLVESRQGGLHFLAGVGLQPLHVGLEDHLEVAAGDALAEARVAVLARGRRHQALEFDHLPLAAEPLGQPRCRRPCRSSCCRRR